VLHTICGSFPRQGEVLAYVGLIHNLKDRNDDQRGDLGAVVGAAFGEDADGASPLEMLVHLPGQEVTRMPKPDGRC